MVKIIWKHKKELVKELCMKAGILDPEDKRNIAKLNTTNLHFLLKTIDPTFSPFLKGKTE